MHVAPRPPLGRHEASASRADARPPLPQGATALSHASHYIFAEHQPAVGMRDGNVLHGNTTYVTGAADMGGGPAVPRRAGQSPLRERRPRPTSASSRRSTRSASSAGTRTSRASRSSTRSRASHTGLSKTQEADRQKGFVTRYTATEQMKGIPTYDALRDRNLPSHLKDTLLRTTYSAQAHSRRERRQLKMQTAPAPGGRRTRPSSAGPARSQSQSRPGSAPRMRPSSAGPGRRTTPVRDRPASTTRRSGPSAAAQHARIRELWEELRIPQHEREFFATRLRDAAEDPEAMQELVQLADALEEHRSRTLQALNSIDLREGQLVQLKELSESIVRSGGSADLMKQMGVLLKALRYSSFECVEAIVEWRLALSQPQAFLWKGMNYVLKMKDDMEVIDAATSRLQADGSQLANLEPGPDFTAARERRARAMLAREEEVQQDLFKNNDALLELEQWLPTLRLSRGPTTALPMQSESATRPPGGPDAADRSDGARNDGGAHDPATSGEHSRRQRWAQIEARLLSAHRRTQTKRGLGGGLIAKSELRRELLAEAGSGHGRGSGLKRATVDKVWRRLSQLYGKLDFRDVSKDELRLAVLACRGTPHDPRTVRTPLLVHADGADAACDTAAELCFDVRVAFTEIFRRFDSNGDGALSRAELNSFQQSVHGTKLGKETLDWIFANHDVDARGNISLDGFLECVREQAVENLGAITWELSQLGYTVDSEPADLSRASHDDSGRKEAEQHELAADTATAPRATVARVDSLSVAAPPPPRASQGARLEQQTTIVPAASAEVAEAAEAVQAAVQTASEPYRAPAPASKLTVVVPEPAGGKLSDDEEDIDSDVDSDSGSEIGSDIDEEFDDYNIGFH